MSSPAPLQASLPLPLAGVVSCTRRSFLLIHQAPGLGGAGPCRWTMWPGPAWSSPACPAFCFQHQLPFGSSSALWKLFAWSLLHRAEPGRELRAGAQRASQSRPSQLGKEHQRGEKLFSFGLEQKGLCILIVLLIQKGVCSKHTSWSAVCAGAWKVTWGHEDFLSLSSPPFHLSLWKYFSSTYYEKETQRGKG